MIILEANISNITRDRDFGMIEARVTLYAKTRTGQPPRPISVHTHVPARGGNLRARLVADASLMARYLMQQPKTTPLHRAA
ncbi:hypothetical protein [Oceaniglobus ichthyenteri]|uniref:hypothetical protein n=1 Tax=Oceaniglobus ichthyenteri TaxID=2136177 RepID=UPI000D366B23|nr:hypothetical protein [Oceaniglobus ichthyenteri]